MVSELEKEFKKCWNRMLDRAYTCKCESGGNVGFAVKLRHLHIFGRDFMKDFFKTIDEKYQLREEE